MLLKSDSFVPADDTSSLFVQDGFIVATNFFLKKKIRRSSKQSVCL